MAAGDKERRAAERFLGLLKPIERQLEAYSRRLIFNSEDALDAIQNAVLRAYRAFDRYHEDASFRAWMFKILTNEIFALNRKRGRIAKFEVPVDTENWQAVVERAHAEEYPNTAVSMEDLSSFLDEDLVRALETLNEVEKSVLLMKSVGGLRYREIAESLEIPMGSVMGYLFRARQKMRNALLRSRRRIR
ncbi:MAG: sigma-70 family RNA polymerase sigma factor [candidate division Zixibacteria bacterium]|nr:sigma-70 family RNA polymerase sigma factor [candidate division Zixibacteria bacterium]MCI0594983.1 sigma-70 family RNA polymerase sigma factor [candidate division Zixibacteria bacterium]